MNKTIGPVFIAEEDIDAFYLSKVKKGTVLYTHNVKESSIQHEGKNSAIADHWRFVFDTMKGAKGHDDPKGNIRCAIWFSEGKFDSKISEVK